MAYRIKSSDITGVIDFDPSINDLTPFIEAAEELVTEVCQNASALPGIPSANQPPYTAARLAIIEKWLAAHFLAIRDPRFASETTGPASASYQQQVGLNLGLTPYGQQAMLLDTKGGLAWLDKHISQGKRPRVGITWLGTPTVDRLVDYPWRFFGIFQ